MCLPVTGQMPATKTFKKGGRFIFLESTDPSQPHAGTVSIVRGRDVDSYRVGVEAIGRGAHEVLFVNVKTAEIYAVECSPAGKPVRCSCRGFAFKKTCKHLDCSEALIADDIIPLRSALPEVLNPATCELCGNVMNELGTSHWACQVDQQAYLSEAVA